MNPQPSGRPGALHWWYAVGWTFLGLCPPVIAVWDQPGVTRYWSVGLSAAAAVCYALTDARLLRPYAFLCALVSFIGAMSFLLGGGAALYIVSLPLFWIYARRLRHAVALSGAAAAVTVGGGALRHGWNADFLTGNAVFTLIGYVAGAFLGAWMHRMLEQRDERARHLSAELEAAQRELTEAHQRQGAADERERIAREIHDTLAQGFASIIALAEAAREGIAADPDRSSRQLLSIERTARDNLAEARALVGSAPAVAAGSVSLTLRRALDRFAEDTGLTVTADLPDLDCDQPTRIALLRCTQESLANVRKHAAATTVSVVLTRHSDAVELEITDDGRGFRTAEARGFGLDGMRRRLAELGGELTVTSSLGDGTRILAAIPTDERCLT
ncbi:sensor histidine kinase [Actinocorallia populi]|uniref:sensor histidine kinase n=1 Tax=Actinocorallia populi TaxID=2079200 RepID=UPI000D0887D3|nr:sensor histidine kinase [Actinocorallia populi]